MLAARLCERGSVVPAWWCVAEMVLSQVLEKTVASGVWGVLGSRWHQPLRKSCYAMKI